MSLPTSSSKPGSAQPLGQGPSRLDSALSDQLEKVVEEMTHSGRPALEEKPLKQLKKICKTSEAYVEHAFHLLSSQLMEPHAEIRLSAFQITNELFNRSHRFRELLVADMQEFLELTVETSSDNPLPPPKAAAKLLKEQTLKAIQEWNAKYGKAYKKLALGYGFLKYNKMVDFANLEARSAAERQAQAARQAKMQLALAQKVSKTLNEMDETIPEMNECLTQIENCFELLLPHPARYADPALPSEPVESTTASTKPIGKGVRSTPIKGGKGEGTKCTKKSSTDQGKDGRMAKNSPEGDGRDDDGEDKDSEDVEGKDGSTVGKEDSLLQQHGLPSWNYNIDINIDTDGVTLEEDEDNQAILTTLEDMNRLITSSYLPRLAVWIEVFNKSGQHGDKIKRCLDLKQALKEAGAKYAELNIQADTRGRQTTSASSSQGGKGQKEDDSDDDETFEDVPEKEGFEPVIPDHLREEYGLEPHPSAGPSHAPPNPDGGGPKATPGGNPAWGTASASQGDGPGVWHPLREAKHDLADPSSQAGTILAMKERLRTIRDMQMSGKRKSSTPSEEVSGKKRQRQDLLAKAPVVPFGVDLEHWANPEKIEAPTVVLADTAQRVWSSSAPDEVKVMEAAKDSLTTRVISYTGEFQPVKWTCRAPLPSGKLCQRMDRLKCPFHGKIIPRDAQGNPQKVEDKAQLVLSEEQKAKAKALLSEAELGRDIEAGLGMDLGGATTSGLNSKGGKKAPGKAKKYPNLTDLKKKSNTALNRLEKRVLNKSALRRVANAMNKLESKRYHDKFANNFNYR